MNDRPDRRGRLTIWGRRPALALLAAAGLWTGALAGCSEDCCTVDSFPIALDRAALGDGVATGGALLAVASAPDAPGRPTFPMVVDTGSPVTILAGPAGGDLQTMQSGFDLFDGGDLSPPLPLRARFRNLDVLQLPLQPVGDAAAMTPGGILGADLMHNFSIEFHFGALCSAGGTSLCASMTFWNHLGADESFLEDAGFALIYFTLFGGGEVTANGDSDFLGLRGPLEVPPTRVVLRSCAVPSSFDPGTVPTGPLSPACCTVADAASPSLKSGVDLSLLIDTGVGPLVLSQSAWTLVVAEFTRLNPGATLPTPVGNPLLVATWPVPIDAVWSTIPRFTLVNLEAGVNLDPGPCVELARSRRTEIVSYQTVMNPLLATPVPPICGSPCDVDPNNSGEAQNSAAYLEIGGAIPVAIIADSEPFLQALRFDVLPEGPELDGLVGADALGRSRLEIDYLSSPARAVFSCEPDAARDVCWSAARCPQLPDRDHQHVCFGLPAHGLPAACQPSGCASN
jgi:hypothetical protein